MHRQSYFRCGDSKNCYHAGSRSTTWGQTLIKFLYFAYMVVCHRGKRKKEALANAEKAIKAYMRALAKPEKNEELTRTSIDIPLRYLYA